MTQALTAQITELRTAPEGERRLGKAVAVYCRWLAADGNLAKATKVAYRRDVLDFAEAMGDTDVRLICDVEPEHVELWKHELSDLESSTVHRKMTAVSRFFVWCALWGMVPRNPVAGVDRPPKRHKEPVHLTAEHFQRLLAACQNVGERAVLGCLFWAGLRRQEVVDLTVNSVNLEEREIRVLGKGGHIRKVPVCRNLVPLLKDHLDGVDRSDPNAPLFLNRRCAPLSAKSVHRWFRRWCRHAGLAPCGYTPHSARHGAGTLMGQEGLDLHDISQFLGHCDPRTTMHYIHANAGLLRRKLDEIEAFGSDAPERADPDETGDVRRELAEMRSMLERVVAAVGGTSQTHG